MRENKFKVLDNAICAHIQRGAGHPMYSSTLATIARPLLASNRTPFPTEWGLIERRMQTMRKLGRLAYERAKGGGHGHWVVVTPNVEVSGLRSKFA